MKTFKSNFKVLSRTDMKNIFGGLLPGSATANCGNGTSVTCHGDSCVAFDSAYSDPALAGHCACWTDDANPAENPAGHPDLKKC